MAATANPFRTLAKHRNFRLFWGGQTLSLIGTWMQKMAVGWLALELTNSAFMVGLVAAASSLPILLFSFYAGVVVDRSDKLRLVRIAQVLLLVEASMLWFLTATGHVTIGWVLALATFNGLVSSLEIPARQSLVIELVGRDDLHDAIALNSSGFNLARVVGPGVSAAVIAKLGMAWCFGVNAISYLAVLVGLFMIRLPAWVRDDSVTTTPLEGILEGFRYMRGTPFVWSLIRLVAVYSVLGVPFLTLMPVVARDVLHLGAGGYGLLLSSVGIGGLLGALWLAAQGDAFPRGRLLSVSSSAFAGLLVLFALVRTPMIAVVMLFGIGFFMIVNSALANSLLQAAVPDDMRGRLMAAYSFIVVGLGQVLGSLAGGSIARVIGADWAIGLTATVMLAYTLWAFRAQPELRVP
ncbi:MAG TPA: MFS transporter [Gemmatimonadaceae bacterium]